ncbi:MAG: 30S ribosome-binding factor RbfA [bacterium]|nr:30S ribosome-binding factor RbfA [bacterium]
MGTYRQEKISELLREEIGKILLRELDFDADAIVTVTRAIVSEDRNHAKIYVSVLPSQFAEEAMEAIKKQVYFLQQALNKKMRIRPVPRIAFVLDRTEEEAARIEKIIDETKEE